MFWIMSIESLKLQIVTSCPWSSLSPCPASLEGLERSCCISLTEWGWLSGPKKDPCCRSTRHQQELHRERKNQEKESGCLKDDLAVKLKLWGTSIKSVDWYYGSVQMTWQDRPNMMAAFLSEFFFWTLVESWDRLRPTVVGTVAWQQGGCWF